MIDGNVTAEIRGLTNLGLDTRNTALAKGTGVASYAEMLGKTVTRIGFSPQWLTGGTSIGKIRRLGRAMLPHQTLDSAFSAPDLFRAAQVHFNLYRRPLVLHAKNPPPIMHWTYPLPLLLNGSRNIVTVHDIIPLREAGLSKINGPRLRRLLDSLLRNMDGIVSVSETVRAQMIAELGLSPERVHNLYQAVDVSGWDSPPAGAIDRICPAGSFVAVGTVEPRKNIARLIAAHAASGVAAPLVIIGPDGDGAAGELAGAGANVRRVSYAPRQDLLRAMARARAVLFPSLSEGFGLPIAEAFALGVPVMTSRWGATEEIAGGAAILVNPYDIAEMSRAIGLLAQSDQFCAGLKAKGAARGALFTADAYGSRLARYYNKILSGPVRK